MCMCGPEIIDQILQEMELSVFVSYPIGVLGMELRSSANVVCS